ncbi:substrate-binding periplasmic protein [Gynuella sunshinyii]|uniref:ABC-type amino acid transport/signal transduction system, periplasmic component/domain n=1 Tax=Gynuella sunshinyii YC6258 TaxID=1445510 RepID=A0A0C5V2K5_9GAMM|nr:transporter substrate-binding domain-containing protein [Gynuella sunshinyii]AJQ93715.1 ABC-type amino acid transport/signal transduction system, periplasmic component/domain [Gynuella sunshinyii YC6258]
MNIVNLMKVMLIAVLAQHALAEVKVSVDHANPPFMYINNGKAAGIYPALIAAAFEKMKEPVEINALPWSRAIEDIENANAGVGGIYKNSERLKKYDYSDQIFVEKLMVYYNKAKTVSFKTANDLKGMEVGVIRGWSYGDDFDSAVKAGEITVSEVTSDGQNFSKLNSGRLDAVIAIEASGTIFMQKFPGIAVVEVPIAENPTYLAFSKNANMTAVLDKFNKAITSLQASGDFDRIVREALTE